jgi:hypothetical protein
MALTEEEGNNAYFEDFELLLHEPQDEEGNRRVAQGLFREREREREREMKGGREGGRDGGREGRKRAGTTESRQCLHAQSFFKWMRQSIHRNEGVGHKSV